MRVQKMKAKASDRHLTVLSCGSCHSHNNSISQNSKLFAECMIIKMVKAWSSCQYCFCLQIFKTNVFYHWKHSSCAAQRDKEHTPVSTRSCLLGVLTFLTFPALHNFFYSNCSWIKCKKKKLPNEKDINEE